MCYSLSKEAHLEGEIAFTRFKNTFNGFDRYIYLMHYFCLNVGRYRFLLQICRNECVEYSNSDATTLCKYRVIFLKVYETYLA